MDALGIFTERQRPRIWSRVPTAKLFWRDSRIHQSAESDTFALARRELHVSELREYQVSLHSEAYRPISD